MSISTAGQEQSASTGDDARTPCAQPRRKSRVRGAPTAVSLFTGAGGLDYGFETAGFRTAVAVEQDADACDVIRRNRPAWPVIERDMHAVPSEEILATAGLARGEADMLLAGPPCQPFSKASFWSRTGNRRLDDPRADTLTACLRVIEALLPRAFLIENVQGLVYRSREEGIRRLLGGIAEINGRAGTRYESTWRVLDAADYGVPQHRRRVFIVGSREGRIFSFPEPTHGPQNGRETRGGPAPYRTCWDAIGHDQDPQAPYAPDLAVNGKWGGLLPSIPEGRNYLWHTHRGGGLRLFGWRTRYWNFLLKLAKNRPAWTIPAQPGTAVGPFHWTNRRLDAREMARIQTFPHDVHFECSNRITRKLIGNAVASLIAEVLAREIRRQLLDGAEDRTPPKLLPRARGGAPKPEPTAAVPARYLDLVGHHPDHPTTRRAPPIHDTRHEQ